MFRGTNNGFASTSAYTCFQTSDGATFNVYGNIMSLLTTDFINRTTFNSNN